MGKHLKLLIKTLLNLQHISSTSISWDLNSLSSFRIEACMRKFKKPFWYFIFVLHIHVSLCPPGWVLSTACLQRDHSPILQTPRLYCNTRFVYIITVADQTMDYLNVIRKLKNPSLSQFCHAWPGLINAALFDDWFHLKLSLRCSNRLVSSLAARISSSEVRLKLMH